VWPEISLPDLLEYDIVPAPAEGNSVDVTKLTDVFKDPDGNYCQTRTGAPGAYKYDNCFAAFNPVTKLYYSKWAELKKYGTYSAPIHVDYIVLDAAERVRMSEIEHEYLVTQLQFQGGEPVAAPSTQNGANKRKFALNFNHPVREIVFVYQAAANYGADPVSGNTIFQYGFGGGDEVFVDAKLIISDRFSSRSGSYFMLVRPYQHQVRVPSKAVYVYSFAIEDADSTQPNGTANFTLYDSAQLAVTLHPNLPTGRVLIYEVNYNILRIAQGMGGLAFAS
jgi:hypothetical protein